MSEDFTTTRWPDYEPPTFDSMLDAIRKAEDLMPPAPMRIPRIVECPYLPKQRQETQFRFPRSKKNRTRKKWRKDPCNWRVVERDACYLATAPEWDIRVDFGITSPASTLSEERLLLVSPDMHRKLQRHIDEAMITLGCISTHVPRGGDKP